MQGESVRVILTAFDGFPLGLEVVGELRFFIAHTVREGPSVRTQEVGRILTQWAKRKCRIKYLSETARWRSENTKSGYSQLSTDCGSDWELLRLSWDFHWGILKVIPSA